MIEICASVAFAGEFFAIVRSVPLSHADRSVGESVFVSRLHTLSVLANSLSITRSRLSSTPASARTSSVPTIRPFSFMFSVL